MKNIRKGDEPRSLTEHRCGAHNDYENYGDKVTLRNKLLEEQGSICCYCLNRIDSQKMKIEHWFCQQHENKAEASARQLLYTNLLGACLGGHGYPEKAQTCDTRKGNSDLKWNPATDDVESRLHYEADGTLNSSDTEFNTQINSVLNLNFPRLKENRKAVIDSVALWWRQEKQKRRGQIPTEAIRKKLESYSTLNSDGAYEPFCQVAVYWFRKKLGTRNDR